MLSSKIIFLFFVIKIINGYNFIYECSQNTPTFDLENNTINLFQSPHFPKSIGSNSSSASCNAIFTTNNPSINIWITMFNGVASDINFYDTKYTSNKLEAFYYNSAFDTVTFTSVAEAVAINVNASQYLNEWTAFQAIVITFPHKIDSPDCPLGGQTFDLSSSDFVVPVTPTFNLADGANGYKLCNWFFTIGSNQKLKIVVRKINLTDNITLTLQDDKSPPTTYIFKNEDLRQVYYVDGQRFNFTYRFNHANISNSGFLLFVSAVNQTNTYTSNGCQPANTTARTTVYSNMDYANGYPSNQQCVNSVTVLPNHEAQLYVVEYNYEGISDQLILNYGNSQSTAITWRQRKTPYIYKLTSNITDGQLIFTSDGNTQGAGYTAFLDTYECKCSDTNFVIQCGKSADLKPMSATNSFQYCSNMDCNYTIIANSSCPNSYFSIYVRSALRNTSDYLIINENGNAVQTITGGSQTIKRYYSSKTNVTIQFHSGSSPDPVTTEDKLWYIDVAPMVTPVFVNKTINKETPNYVQWLAEMGENDALTVCTTTGTLEMFVGFMSSQYDLSNVLLYDDGDLNNYIGSLNRISTNLPTDLKYPQNRKSSSGCFTLYVPDDSVFNNGYSALFRIAEDAEVNCKETYSVFQAPPNSITNAEYDISVTSTDNGNCEMIILASVDYSSLLPHVWISNINASANQQYSFYSTAYNKTLFELNGSEASQYQYVGIYTTALSILVPPSSNIAIHLSETYQVLQWINVIYEGTQKGIMASPSYGGFKQKFNVQKLYQSSGNTNIATTFNVNKINGNAQPILENGGKNQTLVQGTYNTTGAFTLYYAETDPVNNGFFIEYLIQSNAIPSQHTNSAQPAMFEISMIFLSALFLALLHQ